MTIEEVRQLFDQNRESLIPQLKLNGQAKASWPLRSFGESNEAVTLCAQDFGRHFCVTYQNKVVAWVDK